MAPWNTSFPPCSTVPELLRYLVFDGMQTIQTQLGDMTLSDEVSIAWDTILWRWNMEHLKQKFLVWETIFPRVLLMPFLESAELLHACRHFWRSRITKASLDSHFVNEHSPYPLPEPNLGNVITLEGVYYWRIAGLAISIILKEFAIVYQWSTNTNANTMAFLGGRWTMNQKPHLFGHEQNQFQNARPTSSGLFACWRAPAEKPMYWCFT